MARQVATKLILGSKAARTALRYYRGLRHWLESAAGIPRRSTSMPVTAEAARAGTRALLEVPRARSPREAQCATPIDEARLQVAAEAAWH